MLILVSLTFLLVGLSAPSLNAEDQKNGIMTQVQAVVNSIARLPCDLTAPVENDFVTLIIWYREESDSPLYSVDARGRPLEQAGHWSEKSYSGRIFFQPSDKSRDGLSRLSLKNINQTDEGSYKCRVDFKKSPTRNSFVNLTVIVPPSKLILLNDKSEVVTRPLIGPYSEGDTVVVTCVSTGGNPLPTVSWWLDREVVDDTDEIVSGDQVKNEMVIRDLGRHHAGKVYTCQAVNADALTPLNADVRIDMYLKILEVRLLGENLSLSAGSEYEVACQTTGSRPPATITWWKAGQLLEKTREKTSPDGNVTVSTLTFTPTTDDLGKSLSCRATNSHVPGSAREDTWTLNVHYPPQVTLTLGSNINGSSIREGVDVYFECSVKANPWIRLVTWQHGGRNLTNNATAGTIIANQTLVLQSVSRQNTGLYTCSASNSEGSAESNAFQLDVKYEPQCRSGQQRIYGAARNEVISIACEVDSNPTATLFRWTFNNSLVKSKEVDFRTFEGGGKSVASYAPTNEQGYGTLLCWGRNELGPQLVPCVFHVVPAGKPEAPKNCNVRNTTQTSFHVACTKGFDGGLPQEFTLEVFDSSSPSSGNPGRLIVNVTRRLVPEFSVGSLEPGGTYFINVYSSNNKGKSSSGVPVKVTTLKLTQQEHRRNMPVATSKAGFLSTNNPLFWLCMGGVAVVTLTALSLIIVLRVKGATIVCCCDADDENTPNSNSRTESTEDPAKITAGVTVKGIGKNYLGEDVTEVDERNPDVIPLTNDLEHTSLSDLAEGDHARNWKNNSDAHIAQPGGKVYGTGSNYPVVGPKANLVYEVPAPIDKWTHEVMWSGDQSTGLTPGSQYNIVLNKQNMVFVDPSLNKMHQNPIVLTTLAIDPASLTPSTDPAQTAPDVSLNPCILLKQNPEALLATISENLQIVGQNSQRTRLYNTMPSKTKHQNAETQTPRLVRHKESAV